MMPVKYMLDTDIFSFLIDGRHPEVRKAVARHQKAVSISVLTYAEVLFGARKRNSPRLESLVEMFRELFPVVQWTDAAASVYADIRNELESSGTPIGDMDMLIASAAIAGGYVLVTNNMRHFSRVKGLTLANWATS